MFRCEALFRVVEAARKSVLCTSFLIFSTLAGGASAQGPDGNGADLPSANALFREFKDEPVDATNRYQGKAVTLEGLRGDVILSSDGISAAVHIPDGGKTNALILVFPDRNELAGIKRGQKFAFTCMVEKFEYENVWLDDCAIAKSIGLDTAPGGKAPPEQTPRLLSANALYRAFEENKIDANNRYVGKIVTLEGLRGDIIAYSDGSGAAVHIPDRGITNALILTFPDRREVAALKKGQRFAFTCRLTKFEYLRLWLDGCSLN
jgi:tRNA_anti-like